MTVTTTPDVFHHGLNRNNRNPYGATLVTIPDGMRGDDVLRFANLDWSVEKGDEVFVRTPLGDVRLPNSGQYALDGGVPIGIGAAGPDFGTIQHTTLFEAGEYLISEGLATGWSQAGHIGYSRVFGILDLADECRLDDQHQRKLLLSTAHDATGSAKARPWNRRIRCTNEFGLLFKRGGGIISIPHKRNGQVNAERLASSLLAIAAAYDEQDSLLEEFERTPVTARQAEVFVEEMFPDHDGILDKPRWEWKRGDSRAYGALMDKRSDLRHLINYGPTMDNLREGGLNKAVLLHGFVEWSNYFSPTRTKAGVEVQAARAKRMLTGLDTPGMVRAAQVIAAL